MQKKPPVGVSACLLGEKCRYDGGDVRSRIIADLLSEYLDFIPFCPEVGIGLPVPREPIRLMGSVDSPQLVCENSGRYLTSIMQDWIKSEIEKLKSSSPCGFIFKRSSPSCGLNRVRLWFRCCGANGRELYLRMGTGMFARAVRDSFPFVPAVQEDWLADVEAVDSFLERVFLLWELRKAILSDEVEVFKDFHTRARYMFISRSPQMAERLEVFFRCCARMDYDVCAVRILAIPRSRKYTVYGFSRIIDELYGDVDKRTHLVLESLIRLYGNSEMDFVSLRRKFREILSEFNPEHHLLKQYILNPHPVDVDDILSFLS